ncbi:MAG: HYR domain-containing protein [Acidobacteria bacterium]|nr:HYR domain-containing protein [Acidobacteriota bacterium]
MKKSLSSKSFQLNLRVGLIVSLLLPAVVFSGLFIASPPKVQGISSTIVISQLYGGGGNTGATFRNDFIELFNRGNVAVSLNGWSVQYASATGTTWQVTNLTNVSLQPGQYYLVQEAAGTGGTTNLPTPDATGTIAMSGTAGKVALVNTATALSGACPTGASIIDFVGFGTTANCFETAVTPAPSNTTAVIRGSNGCTETDNNSTDFATGAPNPRNTASAFNVCGGGAPNLTINDVSLNEGNAGITSFTFTVSLSQPAGAGGVTFDIATADNTATQPSDYTQKTLTSQTIPSGSSTYSFTVLVNGDTTPEANETFFVNVTNVTGATVTDGQGQGTIVNDDSAPNLSINDVSLNEGNAGTTTFTFTVSLSSSAPAGGVTFDIATADSTATQPSDYTQKTLTGQTIPAGSSTYTLDVLVNGDTNVEPNETFFVNVTNVTNAVVVDGQGQGTIVNDDVATTPIHDIQGSGSTSPLLGQVVTTTGIVTALRTSSYFIQTPDANIDADPNTSEGILVFTAPGTLTLGALVQVTGTVAEFRSSSANINSATSTELTSATASVLSTGNPLPTPITLTTADTSPMGSLEQLEKFEDMRVHINSLTVIAPTSGNKSEANATATSNGVFFGVITGIARPFREPGIEAPKALPTGSSVTIPPVPRFDANPERIRIDSDAQTGATAIDVTSGALVTNLTGVLDPGGFPNYTLYPDASTPPTVSGNVTFTAVPVPTATEFTVASFNVERFYDNIDDAGGDVVLTLTAFNNRLNKASLAIRNVLQTPDILGVEEMEDLKTLQALATKINNDAVAASQPNPMYVAYLQEGNDVGLIDVGFLVKSSRVTVIEVTQFGKTTTYINPNNGAAETLNDRPPLMLRATVPTACAAQPFAVTVFVNHLRSLNGVDDDTPDGTGTAGTRVRAKRRAQAEFLADLIQARQVADPTENIISIGDYNAFQFNDGLGDSIGTIKGTPTPANQVVLASSDLVNPDLVDLIELMSTPADQKYSFCFDGNAQALDHELVNQPLMNAFSRFAYARVNGDFPEVYRSDATRPERISDHDAAVAYFTLPTAPQPTISCPANIMVSNTTDQCAAVVTFTVNGNDPCGGTVNIIASPPSGSSFPVGTTTVTATATSSTTGQSNSCMFTVTVSDTQAPTLTCPANVTTTESSPGSGAVVNYSAPTVNDNCPCNGGATKPFGQSPQTTIACTPVCSPASGSTFTAGTTTVTCTATDAAGNQGSCTFTVMVNAACSLTCPANITKVNDANQCGAVTTYAAPTTMGSCGTVTCSPASGAFFSKGTTTVTCTTAAGPSCAFTVTVNDTQPPVITCPPNKTAVTANPAATTAVVNYAAPTVSDNCSGVGVVCTPASGTTFPLGTTTVTCTATDTSGNTATCSFTVTVFNLCLQDDGNPQNVVLANSQTGQYRFCCSGSVFTGQGTVRVTGGVYTIEHNPADRRVTIKLSAATNSGTASLQNPIGVTRCSITDRDIRNNSCSCQ